MANRTQLSRRAIRERARKRRKQQRVIPALLLVAIGVGLIGGAWLIKIQCYFGRLSWKNIHGINIALPEGKAMYYII